MFLFSKKKSTSANSASPSSSSSTAAITSAVSTSASTTTAGGAGGGGPGTATTTTTSEPVPPSPQQAIENAYDSLIRFIEAETDCTGISMDVLERINWTATSNYSRLADSAKSALDPDACHISQLNSDIQTYIDQVDSIASYIDSLEALTKEIDEWSREIEVKSRRYARPKSSS